MARRQGSIPAENTLLNPGIPRSRRVIRSSSNEDLFLNLANDEPADNFEPGSRPQNAVESGPATSNQGKASSGLHQPRRSASTQIYTGPLSSPVTANGSFPADRYSPSPPPFSPTRMTDTSSDIPYSSTTDSYSSMRPSAATFSVPGRRQNSSPAQLDMRSVASRQVNGYKRTQRSALRPSKLAYETPQSHNLDEVPYPAGSPSPILNSTTDTAESVGSTTAASTVWDELEELRQRIRRLEYNGSRTRSGATPADDNVDRPHTATTETTTSSISHAERRAVSSPIYPTPADPSPSHPLLYSALQKAKSTVYPEVYESLEASVSDALEIASSVTKPGSQSQVDPTQDNSTSSNASLQRLHRKSESLCRSLTELCIALCEDGSRRSRRPSAYNDALDSPAPQSFSGNEQSPLHFLEERRARMERAGTVPPRPSSRTSRSVVSAVIQDDPANLDARKSILSRLEQRRKSKAANEQSPYSGPRSHSRATMYLSQEENEDQDPTIRAPSRAMTEVEYKKHSTARGHHKFSRDYVSRHPLPDLPPSSAHHSIIGTKNHSDSSTTKALGQSPGFGTLGDNQDFSYSQNGSMRGGSGLKISATLAERLEARRQQQKQQQVATADQLGTISSSASMSTRSASLSRPKRPSSSGRPL